MGGRWGRDSCNACMTRRVSRCYSIESRTAWIPGPRGGWRPALPGAEPGARSRPAEPLNGTRPISAAGLSFSLFCFCQLFVNFFTRSCKWECGVIVVCFVVFSTFFRSM